MAQQNIHLFIEKMRTAPRPMKMRGVDRDDATELNALPPADTTCAVPFEAALVIATGPLIIDVETSRIPLGMLLKEKPIVVSIYQGDIRFVWVSVLASSAQVLAQGLAQGAWAVDLVSRTRG